MTPRWVARMSPAVTAGRPSGDGLCGWQIARKEIVHSLELSECIFAAVTQNHFSARNDQGLHSVTAIAYKPNG